MRQFDDVQQADVAFATLNTAYIVSMQVRQLREAFLGQTALRPQNIGLLTSKPVAPPGTAAIVLSFARASMTWRAPI